MLNIKQELAKLKDIHEPNIDISILPLAPIWYIFITLVILFIIALVIFKAYRKKNYLKRTALQKLNNIEKSLSNNLDNLNIINNISILIRKTALLKFKNKNLASITDTKWLEFLDSKLDKKYFQTDIGDLLINANYQKKLPENSNLKELINICRIWIKTNL
tara:strand:+ start:7076 stop:7558 length:483 start_codon:yes stop_codon:yes gene_type:complete